MFRRNFLKSSGLLSLTPMVPGFVNHLASAATPRSDQKILVVIEMSGGNDGINTLVPHQDDAYFKLRTRLQIDRKRLHPVTDSLGLHPAMLGSKRQLDAGELSIINGVGYPNPNRSHFESQRIWHHGVTGQRRTGGEGWLGHALDLASNSQEVSMDGYFVGQESVSPALVSRRAQIAALSRFSDLQLDPAISSLTQMPIRDDLSAFVQRQTTSAYATARQIEDGTDNEASGGYPDSRLGLQMRLISRLIKSDSAARVYYTIQNGYDTHSNQPNTHFDLLATLSSSMKAFVDDLKQDSLDDRVVVLAFSEFGRRVEENASLGTDHGTAGPVFLAGTRLKSGLVGKTTSLTDLKDGDLKSQFDFRRIYATLLDRWLGISSEKVLQAKYEHLDLF